MLPEEDGLVLDAAGVKGLKVCGEVVEALEASTPFVDGEADEEGVAGLADLFARGLHKWKRIRI